MGCYMCEGKKMSLRELNCNHLAYLGVTQLQYLMFTLHSCLLFYFLTSLYFGHIDKGGVLCNCM